jgi:glycosyltransferase involved in cell wall biosynthesis
MGKNVQSAKPNRQEDPGVKRVLISAFSCLPGLGSEPGVGWGLVSTAAKRYRVWVLTDRVNQPVLEEEFARQKIANAEFVYIGLPGWLTALTMRRLSDQFYYALWQILALRTARRLHAEIGFDLVHHVTFVNSWNPIWLGRLGIPLIWNAGNRDITPRAFLKSLSWRSRQDEKLRNALLTIFGALSARVVGRHARWVLSNSPAEAWGPGIRLAQFAIGGLSSDELTLLNATPARTGGPLRVASLGRLIGFKGFSFGLKAFASVHRQIPNSEYWLVGEGPEESRLRDLASELGLESAVKFLPWQTREDALRILGEIDILLHPSLHEQFAYVVLEAMAAGRPVLCLDRGGPSLLVDDDCGIKISATDPDQVTRDLANALLHLGRNAEIRRQMGETARRRALEKWNWEAVGERIFRLYESQQENQK